MNIKYTKEQLAELVIKSYSFSDVLNLLNMSKHGGSVDHIKKRLIYFEIDFSHFKGRAWAKGMKRPNTANRYDKIEFEDKFLKINGAFIISNKLKLRLIEHNLLKNECVVCGNDGTWQNKKLILQLDHINGNNKDNRLVNLRIMCPNCHTQTNTYSGSKNKKENTLTLES